MSPRQVCSLFSLDGVRGGPTLLVQAETSVDHTWISGFWSVEPVGPTGTILHGTQMKTSSGPVCTFTAPGSVALPSRPQISLRARVQTLD